MVVRLAPPYLDVLLVLLRMPLIQARRGRNSSHTAPYSYPLGRQALGNHSRSQDGEDLALYTSSSFATRRVAGLWRWVRLIVTF